MTLWMSSNLLLDLSIYELLDFFHLWKYMIPWQRDEEDKFQTLGFIAYFSPTNFYQLEVGQELISVIASIPKYTYHILPGKR